MIIFIYDRLIYPLFKALNAVMQFFARILLKFKAAIRPMVNFISNLLSELRSYFEMKFRQLFSGLTYLCQRLIKKPYVRSFLGVLAFALSMPVYLSILSYQCFAFIWTNALNVIGLPIQMAHSIAIKLDIKLETYADKLKKNFFTYFILSAPLILVRFAMKICILIPINLLVTTYERLTVNIKLPNVMFLFDDIFYAFLCTNNPFNKPSKSIYPNLKSYQDLERLIANRNVSKIEEPVDKDYELFDLKRDATEREIKKSYRKLSLKHHPDKGGDQEKFQEINAAHQRISYKLKLESRQDLNQEINDYYEDPYINRIYLRFVLFTLKIDQFYQLCTDQFSRVKQMITVKRPYETPKLNNLIHKTKESLKSWLTAAFNYYDSTLRWFGGISTTYQSGFIQLIMENIYLSIVEFTYGILMPFVILSQGLLFTIFVCFILSGVITNSVFDRTYPFTIYTLYFLEKLIINNTFQTIIIVYSKVIDIAVEILSIPVRAICLLLGLFTERDTSFLKEFNPPFPTTPATGADSLQSGIQTLVIYENGKSMTNHTPPRTSNVIC